MDIQGLVVTGLAALGFAGALVFAHFHYKRHPSELNGYDPASTRGADSWGPL